MSKKNGTEIYSPSLPNLQLYSFLIILLLLSLYVNVNLSSGVPLRTKNKKFPAYLRPLYGEYFSSLISLLFNIALRFFFNLEI